MGIMEKTMEISVYGLGLPKAMGMGLGLLYHPPIMENQMDKKWKMKWQLGEYRDLMGFDIITALSVVVVLCTVLLIVCTTITTQLLLLL